MKFSNDGSKFTMINEDNVEIGYLQYEGINITDIYIYMGYRANGYAKMVIVNFLNLNNFTIKDVKTDDVIIQKIISRI